MADRLNRKCYGLIVLTALLAACTSKPTMPPVESPALTTEKRSPEQIRIDELEHLLADKQKQCAEEKRRQGSALKESQKKVDDLQKKLNGLLEIDRELRQRNKVR
jgi:type IV pilus biogenesis protein CpaD/CtpE